ncbi:MAG: ATP-dependent RNA helicase dbp6 [Stictis urceolatum]|nr:ATP-dependent RNA helicase dbp6 [Stictis urceolata]
MSSQFYNRYIPSAATKSEPPEPGKTDKGKRELASNPDKRKFGEVGGVDRTTTGKKRVKEDGELEDHEHMYQNSEKHKRSLKLIKKEKRLKEEKLDEDDKVRNEQSDEGLEEMKHSKVLAKFRRSGQISQLASRLIKREAGASAVTEQVVSAEAQPELHGLEPIPQPKFEEDEDIPFMNTLPDWIANPIRCPVSQTVPFETLALSRRTKRALTARGYNEAFAIQSAVLPLLLPGPHKHLRDICIASGTGTGKTLAFILPIIESLRTRASGVLRALIVVPTRELVSQTRALFEACAAKSHIKVAAAEGSKTLKEERKLLVKRIGRWDPEAAAKILQSPIPWKFINDDPSEERSKVNLQFERATLDQGFVPDYRSIIDVLICTPGRLVDHMKSTRGFTLEHVEWFVIDEVDRLLNQSYQEWLNHVMPALEYERKPVGVWATIESNSFKKKRRVRKVIASATLTTDVSKLVSLSLFRPVLVTLEGVDQERATAQFNLPETLKEVAMAIGDVNEKPLYLLHLLKEFMAPFGVSNIENAQALEVEISRNNDSASSHGGSDSDANRGSRSTSVASLSNDSSSSAESRISLADTDSISSESEIDSIGSDGTLVTAAENSGQLSTSTSTPPTRGIVIFTRTNENALRLTRLLKLMRPSWAPQIGCLAGAGRVGSRRKTLSRLRQGGLAVVVASNLAARGLNIGNLAQVVNYDLPNSLESYVHRVGRTARAGNEGKATTLTAHHEGRWFWNEIAKTPKVHRANKVARAQAIEISEEDRESYAEALSRLRDEARGRI